MLLRTALIALIAIPTVQDVKTTKLSDHVYMLVGQGGNLGLSVGDDGVFLIDDQFAPMTKKIQKAVAELSDDPVKFVINTHWHGDHVGGNENFGKAGAVIVAHKNVRKRMSTEQFMKDFGRKVPAAPHKALPVVTFTEEITFHLNGDEIRVFHVEHAHTDGDAIIHFTKENVIHMGDTFFNGMYPFIDASSGGTIAGVISAGEKVLEIADDKTKIIPGHGPLADKTALKGYIDMLKGVRDAIQPLVDNGLTPEEISKKDALSEYDGKWGKGFMKPAQFAGIVAKTLTPKKKKGSGDD